ncbi:recombinase family protein [Amycolatopsis sp. NPDC023774]|uniref:recombinase family protein n=1 Tax=Amycolatopsis sp. NPDC023774 TaxID=3155015 RepID=UPI0033D063CB
MFEERRSGKLKIDERPGLQAALDYMRPGDMLTVQEADRLGRNLLEALIVLDDLFSRGIAVRILEGIAAGEHTERNLLLDMALALAEDRRRDIVRKPATAWTPHEHPAIHTVLADHHATSD